MFTSSWVPYWVTSLMLRGEAAQVSNDVAVWDSKKFGHKIKYRKGVDAD